MSYANCHLIELSIKIVPSKLKLAIKRDDDQCRFTDVTYEPRFQVIKKAKFCSHCDQIERLIL